MARAGVLIIHIKYKNDTAGSKIIVWGDGREDNYTAAGGGALQSPQRIF